MLIRIVKMTFDHTKTDEFVKLFTANKEKIGSFTGCAGVTLLRDTKDPNVFFTYSRWQSAAHLEDYRQSNLFISVWANVKPWFIAKPEAWSLEEQPH